MHEYIRHTMYVQATFLCTSTWVLEADGTQTFETSHCTHWAILPAQNNFKGNAERCKGLIHASEESKHFHLFFTTHTKFGRLRYLFQNTEPKEQVCYCFNPAVEITRWTLIFLWSMRLDTSRVQALSEHSPVWNFRLVPEVRKEWPLDKLRVPRRLCQTY